MGSISLIRHGQASFGKANYDELSDLGHEQGRELGRWFSRTGIRIDHVVTGSLKRHQQTAAAVCQTLEPQLGPQTDWETLPGFNEYDHVEMLLRAEPRFTDPVFLRGLFQDSPNPQKEFQKLFVAAFARWMSGEHDADYTESWPAFRTRCIAALNQLTNSAHGRSRHIAVFTSGGPISAIAQHLLEIPDHRMADLNSSIANASVTRILFQPGRTSLSTLNAYGHFEHNKSLISYR